MINVLVLSASASAVNCILSLAGNPELRLFVTDASPYACGLYHEGITPIVFPRARDLEQYRAALDDVITRHAIDVILPTSDRDIEGIVELLHTGWDPQAKLFRPPYESYRLLANKLSLARFLTASDVPVPRVYASPDQVEFPLVVKPLSEGGTKGVSVVENADQLSTAIDQVQRNYGADYILQEFVPGGTGSIHMVLMLYDHAAQLVSAVAMRSSLTFMTWGGGGNAGTIVDEAEPIRLAERVIELAGKWRGPVCVEFKRHAANGRFYLLEANCRLNGYSYLTTMNGADFPHAILDLLRDGHTRRLPRYIRSGNRNFVLGFRERLVTSWAGDLVGRQALGR